MSSDHQPRTLLMAWKTSSGVWSTAKAAVKLAFPVVLAVMSGLPAGWGFWPSNIGPGRVPAPHGGARPRFPAPPPDLCGVRPPVAVGAGGGPQPGAPTGEPALDAAQGTLRRGEDRCRVPALPAGGPGVSRCQGGAAHRGVEAESPAFVPGLRPARVGDGSQQRPPAREVMRAAHGPQYVHCAVHRVQRFGKLSFAEAVQGAAVRQRAHFYGVAVTADRARLPGKRLHRRALAGQTVRYRLEREARREGSQAELARGLLATAGGR